MVVRGIEQAAKGKDSLQVQQEDDVNSIFHMPTRSAAIPSASSTVQLGLYQKYLRATEVLARDTT